MSFDFLGLLAELLRAVQAQGCAVPTPIRARTTMAETGSHPKNQVYFAGSRTRIGSESFKLCIDYSTSSHFRQYTKRRD